MLNFASRSTSTSTRARKTRSSPSRRGSAPHPAPPRPGATGSREGVCAGGQRPLGAVCADGAPLGAGVAADADGVGQRGRRVALALPPRRAARAVALRGQALTGVGRRFAAGPLWGRRKRCAVGLRLRERHFTHPQSLKSQKQRARLTAVTQDGRAPPPRHAPPRAPPPTRGGLPLLLVLESEDLVQLVHFKLRRRLHLGLLLGPAVRARFRPALLGRVSGL